MAIKVSGTSVINDSRQLQNIASLDSTTISTINANVSTGFTADTSTHPSSATNYNTNPSNSYSSSQIGTVMTTSPPSGIIVAQRQFSSSSPVVAAVTGSFYTNVGTHNGYYGGFLTTWAQSGSSQWTMKQNLFWDSITSSTSGTGTYYIDMGVIYIPAGGKVYLLAGNVNYGQWEFAANAVTINGYYQTAS